jgi:hypothetical protein
LENRSTSRANSIAADLSAVPVVLFRYLPSGARNLAHQFFVPLGFQIDAIST